MFITRLKHIIKSKKITYYSIALLIFAAGSLPFAASAQERNNCSQASVLVGTIHREHVEPRTLDDTFSIQLFEHVITSLDKNATFFTEKDIEQLSKHKYAIDDQIKAKKCDFLKDLTAIYKTKLEKMDANVTDILSNPFNFEKDESLSYTYEGEEFEFAENEDNLKDWWRKKLKLQVLRMARKADTKEDFLSREAEMREKVASRAHRKIDGILNHTDGLDNYVADVYFNSIANLNDPHSTYFSISQKKEFQSHLSKEVLSFGMEVNENRNGKIEVVKLVPGGPAWKTNQIHKGDILEKLTFSDGEEVVLIGLSVDEIQEMLKEERANEITLQVKNSAGISKEVKLQKEKVRADENIIKSFVLKGVENIGYISLPGFYTEWGDGNQGCAEDMAREITKLQLENVQGLILDLRFNGGGALNEAIDLAGIFIDAGVLFMEKYPDGSVQIRKDRNRGTIFDGPLIVMVNEASASASEILSACLQDHNRALIVGSTSYGKATGQNIMPVDSLDQLSFLVGREPKGNGYAKITTTRLYRIMGESYQKKGILPDVEIPSLYKGLIPSEADEPYALDSDPIEPAKYFKPMEPLPIKELKVLSAARITKDEMFNKVIEVNDSLQTLFKNSSVQISLKLDDFLEQNKEPDPGDIIDELVLEDNVLYKVENHRYDASVLSMDTYGKELNEQLAEQIGEDLQISETYRIMLDFIKLNED